MAPRDLTLAIALLCALSACVSVAPASAGELYTRAECTGVSILVRWTLQADPGGYPNFVGYDLYRRTQPECGPPVRLNTEILPRIPGQWHTVTFEDTTVASATMYRYDVRLVDANHQAIIWQEFCDPCFTFAWESCPRFSAPLVHGTLMGDPNWYWVNLWPCVGVDCYIPFLIHEPWPQELEQYMNTGVAVRIYGSYMCANTEGCFIEMTDFDVLPCGGVTSVQEPLAPGTWGTVKAMYR